jgi:hypothetical protein
MMLRVGQRHAVERQIGRDGVNEFPSVKQHFGVPAGSDHFRPARQFRGIVLHQFLHRAADAVIHAVQHGLLGIRSDRAVGDLKFHRGQLGGMRVHGVEHDLGPGQNRPAEKISVVVAEVDGDCASRIHDNAGGFDLLIRRRDVENAIDASLGGFVRENANRQIDSFADPNDLASRHQIDHMFDRLGQRRIHARCHDRRITPFQTGPGPDDGVLPLRSLVDPMPCHTEQFSGHKSRAGDAGIANIQNDEINFHIPPRYHGFPSRAMGSA